MTAERLPSILLLVAATCCFTQVIVESHVLSRCVASDVVFLIDSSTDISGSDFRRQLTFLRDVVDRLPIGPDTDVRVSLVTYGLHPPRIRFPLHRHPSKAQLRDAIESVPQNGGGGGGGGGPPRKKTLADAINLARRTVLLGGIPRGSIGPATGPASRSFESLFGRVMVIVGGARFADAGAAKAEALKARNDGVVVIGVEVGRGVDGEENEEEGDEMEGLASSPTEQYTLSVADFADLAKIRDLTARKICEVKASTAISTGIANVSTDILRSKQSDISDRKHQIPGSDGQSYLPPTHGYFLHSRTSRHASAEVTHRPHASTEPSKQDAIPAVVSSRPTEPVSSGTNVVFLAAQAIKERESRPDRPTTSATSTSLLFNKSIVLGDELDTVVRLAPDSIVSTEVDVPKRYINGEESGRMVTVGVSILKPSTVGSQSAELSATESTVSNARSRDTGSSPSLAHAIESQLYSNTQSTVDLLSIDDQGLLERNLEKQVVSKSNSPLGPMDDDSESSNDQTTEVNSVKVLRRIHDTRNNISEIPVDDDESNKGLNFQVGQGLYETFKRRMKVHHNRDNVFSTDESPRARHQGSPGHREYWRPDESGRLVRYYEISPGVFEKEGSQEFPDPRKRKRVKKPSTRVNFGASTFMGTGFGTKDAHGFPLVGPSPWDRPEPAPEAQTARNHSRSCDDPRHRAASKITGFYRFNDDGRLVWQNFTATQMLSKNRSTSSNCTKSKTSVQKPAPWMTTPRPPFRPKTHTNQTSPRKPGRPESPAGRNPLPDQRKWPVVGPSGAPGHQVTQTNPDNDEKTSDIEDLPRNGHWNYDSSGRRVWITHSPHHQETTPESHRTPTSTPSNTSEDPLLQHPSYGFWNHENGQRIWYEYDPSSRGYRPVNDSTGGGQGSNKVRLELPPSLAAIARSRIKATVCRDCEVKVPRHHGGNDKSRAGDGDFVFEEDNIRLFNSSTGIESHPPVEVSGLHKAPPHRLSRQPTPDPTLNQGKMKERKGKVVAGDDKVLNGLTAKGRRRKRPHNRTTSSSVNDQYPGHSIQTSVRSSSSWDHEKPVKVCTVRHPLSAAFMVDPRSMDRSQAKRLWQLAFEAVRPLRMDDGRVRIQFFPELQRTADSSTGTRSSSAHGDHTMMHTAADRKPVPDLLRSVADVLLNNITSRRGGGGLGGGEPSRKPDRRVIVYLTDGPSGSDAAGLRRAAEGIRARKGIEVFAVGLGVDADPAELASIADASGRRRGGRVFRLLDPSPRETESLARELTLALCGLRRSKTGGSVKV